MSEVKQRKTIVRTSAGIRDALIDEMERVINGESEAKTANAVARLSGELINSVRMELEVEEFKSRLPAVSAQPKNQRALPSMPLGAD